MATIDLTSTANAIKERFESEVHEAVFYNDFLGLSMNGNRLFPLVSNPGDTLYRWKMHSAASGGAETFSEGDGHPDSKAESWVNLGLAYTYVWFVTEVTGHARDALASRHFDPIADSMELGKMGLIDLFNTTLLNDSTVGLAAGIDDDNTYALQARGSAAFFESGVESSVGTLAMTDFHNIHETMRAPEHAAKIGLWLMPPEQVTNYAQLYDYANSDRREVVTNGGKGYDLGFNSTAMACMGAPIAEVPDMTNSVIYGLDIRPAYIPKIVVRREFSAKPLAPTGDNDRIQFSMALAMPVVNPIKQCKLEGVTV